VFSPCVLSSCSIPPPSHMSTSSGQRNSQLFCVHYSLFTDAVSRPDHIASNDRMVNNELERMRKEAVVD
jgi:hypothetical protein